MPDLEGATYHAAGGEQLPAALLPGWAATVRQGYADGLSDFGDEQARAGRWVTPEPLDGPVVPVSWLPVPRQVVTHLGRRDARALCDADLLRDAAGTAPRGVLPGGREWHNEYCEYRIIRRPDARGRLRPKRVELTTELREYWLWLAGADPDLLRDLATETLADRAVTFEDLYGPGPVPADEAERSRRFLARTAGSATTGTPDTRVVPAGPLNTERALFMVHPINGLDDLFFITLFGAQPYARIAYGRHEPAPVPWIFLDCPYFRSDAADLHQLRSTYCRHADPTVARIAQAAALAGRQVSFADPAGVFMAEADLDRAALRFRGGDLPAAWVRWSRPADGTRHQRLVVGPGDEDDAFLDDIRVRRGDEEVALQGGFQLLELLAVSIDVVLGPAPAAPPPADPFYLVAPGSDSIACDAAAGAPYTQLADWRRRYLRAGDPVGDPPAVAAHRRRLHPGGRRR